MSDTLPPIGLTPAEEAEYNAALARQSGIVTGGALSSALTNIAPDPALPGVAGYIPFAGGVERGVSFLGHLGDMAAKPIDAIAGALHLPVYQHPTPDVVTGSGEHAAALSDSIYNSLPGAPTVDPTSPTDALSYALGNTTGAMAPVAPGSVLTGLPSTVAKALHWVLPTTGEGAATKVLVGAGLGAASGGMDAADVAAANAAPGQQQAATPQPTQEASILGKVLTDASYAPVDDVKATAPTSLIGGALAQPTQDTSLIGDALGQQPQQSADPNMRMFAGQGTSDTTVGRVLLDYAAVAVATLAGIYTHRLGSEVTLAGRNARMSDPAYAQQAADYNQARIRQQTSGEISSGISAADQPQSPLPTSNPVQAATTKVRSALLDANASADAYIKLNSDNPSAAERLSAEYGLTHNNSAWETRINEFNKTGRDFVTGQTIPAPMEHQQDVAALSTADKKIYQDTRAARNELNNRTNNTNSGLTNVRHDFPQYDNAQLQTIAARGMSDPVIADLVNRSDRIMNGMIRIGNGRGFFPNQEVNDILAAHPNYLAEVDLNGKIMHPMGPRNSDPYTGIQQVTSPPWSADAQHIEALYRQFEINEQARMMIDKQLDTQKQYPNSAQFVSRVNIPPVGANPSLYVGGGARDPMITVRRSSGTERYRVDNPDFLTMANGDNANKQRISMNSVGIARRLVSQMTTGAGAVLSGRAFPVTHIPRAMLQAQINLPRNRVSGLSDLAFKSATGGRVGQRVIPDPTFIGGALYSNARAAADNLVHQLSNTLKRGNDNVVNNFLRSTLTHGQVDTMSDSMANFYRNSTTHEMAATGVSGAGNVLTAQMPAYMTGDGAHVRLAANSQVPELFMVDGTLGRARPYIVRLRSAVQDILSSYNDSGNQYIYRLNKFYDAQGSRASLGQDVRRMSGDPGEMGSSQAIQTLANTIPYFNVSAQGTRSTARAYADAPVGTSMSMVGAAGSLAALSLLTAMRSKAHMDHLQNTLTTQQRGANPTFYTDPDPSKNIQISLPQEFLRAHYGMMLDLMSKAFNVTAAMHHDGVANDVQTWLKDFLSEHVENSSLDSMLHGVTDMTNFADVPSIINAFVALTGNTVHITDWSKIYNDIQTHQFGFNSFVQPTGGTHALPNQAVGDSILDGENGKRLDVILSNVFGLFGGTLDGLAGIHKYYPQTNNLMDTLGYVGRDWLQGMRDVNPSLNTWVWENQARASVRPPIVDDVENSMRSMKITQGGIGQERYEGTTGPKGLPTADLGERAKVPTDPTMRDMWYRTAQTYKFIESGLMPNIKAIEGQMGSVSNQAMSPEARREWMNARTRDKADAYRLPKAYIDDLNATLSQLVGKHVNVATIDWSKGVEQFH